MEFGLGRVMVNVIDTVLREHVARILTECGYEVFANPAITLKSVVTTLPDVIVLGGNPSGLDFSRFVAEIKASERARLVRIIVLATGGTADRIRDLDLGADDVLSMPFEDGELLSRVRAQLRERGPEDELREAIHESEKSNREMRRLSRALNQGRRTLRFAVAVFIMVTLLGAGTLGLLYWRSQKQDVRVYAALAKLQTGVISEQDLIEAARRARVQVEQSATKYDDARHESLRRQNKELHDKLADADPSQVTELQRQLRASDQRLQKLEADRTVAQDVIRSYSASVCLLHVVVGFRQKSSHVLLRYAAVNPVGSPLMNANSETQVQLGGFGPEVRMDGFGTGFLASSDGRIVTNHHVVEPWWKNDDVADLLRQAPDLEPMVMEMTAYFPGVSHGIPIKVKKISSEADLAVVAGDTSGLKLRLLSMDDNPNAAVSGEPVVLIGYPTGIDAILARTTDDALRSIAANAKSDPEILMAELAHRQLIRPVNTQGHIGDVLSDKIIYDAQTTAGGSGGPLFNTEGKVIAVNVAMLRDFGGSNFAIPVRFAKQLLPN